MKVRATAPGKLILLGEYAVLQGAPALVTAVNRSVGVTVSSASSGNFSFSAPNLNLPKLPFIFLRPGQIRFEGRTNSKLNFMKTALEYIFTDLVPQEPFDLTADSSDFFQGSETKKFGLGSSAALTVALTGALRAWKTRSPQIESETLFRNALAIHYMAQGKLGSGIDIAASLHGGLIRYRLYQNAEKTESDVRQLPLPAGLKIIPIWTGKPASTTRLVGKVQQFQKQSPEEFEPLMEELKMLSHSGSQAFQENNIRQVLKIFGSYFEALDSLGQASGADIISAEHREIAEMIRRIGGVYKPSGAGGGDLGIALTNSEQTAKKIKQEILHSRFKMINLNFYQPGLSLEISESQKKD